MICDSGMGVGVGDGDCGALGGGFISAEVHIFLAFLGNWCSSRSVIFKIQIK